MAEEHHVHFEESNDGLKTNEIVIKKKSENKIEIQLGFLQVHHMYEVTLIFSGTIFLTGPSSKSLSLLTWTSLLILFLLKQLLTSFSNLRYIKHLTKCTLLVFYETKHPHCKDIQQNNDSTPTI